jgi:transcriptional regulator with GAF, ATPase, and Fis domain
LLFGIIDEDGASASAGDDLIGVSGVFRKRLTEVDRAATSDLPILILGETGTGKELIAERVHEQSGRTGELIAVNCGAIASELVESALFGHKKGAFTGALQDTVGYFEGAKDGTIFLDEIGELPLTLQPKLLRVLENREFTPVGGTAAIESRARVVSATNLNLAAEVEAGRFRRDLYARIAGTIIQLPPLRARRIDIPLLARHFLEQFAPDRTVRWTASFLEAMLLHSWPMNVRELRTVMQRLTLRDAAETELHSAALAEILQRPPEVVGPKGAATRRSSRKAPSKEELVQLLQQHHGNVSKLAQHYSRHPRQLYRWLEKHGLNADDFRQI